MGRAHARDDQRRRATPGRRRIPAPALSAVVLGALAWLLLGCSGLIWIIAFTRDVHPLAIALAVWVLAFVVPSVLATTLAYRLEEAQRGDGPAAGD